MSIIPSIELDGSTGFFVIAFLAAAVVLFVYTTGSIAFALGLLFVAVILIAVYVVLVRVWNRLINGPRRPRRGGGR